MLDAVRADAERPKGEAIGSHYSRDTVVISRDEVRELWAALDAVLAPYRRANRTAPPDGAVAFSATFMLAPEQSQR